MHYFMRYPEYLVFRWNITTHGILMKGEMQQMEELSTRCVKNISRICNEPDMEWYLAVGDPVEFTDVDGNRFRYTVTDLEQLLPGQTVDMVGYSEDWDLTLFTCTISGRQRLTVRCSLVEEEPPA